MVRIWSHYQEGISIKLKFKGAEEKVMIIAMYVLVIETHFLHLFAFLVNFSTFLAFQVSMDHVHFT